MSLMMFAAAGRVVLRLAALELSRRVQSVEALTQAIEFDDSNPDFYRQRAALRLTELRFEDYQQAGADLATATRLNPHYWRYWSDWARYQERIGDNEAAEVAYRRAIELSPINGLYHWALFNFLLRQGRREEAMIEIGYALRLDEELREPGLDLLLQLSLDPEQFVEIWPGDSASTLALLQSLSSRPGPDETRDHLLRRLFDNFIEMEPVSMDRLYGLVLYWIARRQPDQAREIWTRYQEKLGVAATDFFNRQNQVWNGDFEQPISPGGIDWTLDRGAFLLLDRVPGEGFQFSYGMRIRVPGRVPPGSGIIMRQTNLAPPGKYRLSCRMRSNTRTVETQLELALLRTNTGIATSLLLEGSDSAEWIEYAEVLEIHPGEETELRIDLKRVRAGKTVTFWIDDIRLSPI